MCLVSGSVEWVEMLELQSQERMYVNVKTGECVWHPPPGVAVWVLHIYYEIVMYVLYNLQSLM